MDSDLEKLEADISKLIKSSDVQAVDWHYCCVLCKYDSWININTPNFSHKMYLEKPDFEVFWESSMLKFK